MSSIEVVALGPEQLDEITEVISHDDGYAVRVNGAPAGRAEAEALLTNRPPDVSVSDLHVLGLKVDSGLVAIASLVTGWPRPDVTYLGLLQVHSGHQGRGLARQFHARLREMFAGTWRLTVADTNAQVLPFWEKLGYSPTGEQRKWVSSSGQEHQVFVLEQR
ncbi:MAG: GNAT family N-acetyltransferase [Buchananella hordeovulneris]|nr:GNAT family N-acetyltransferase [Buchananella hordeovulneris]